MTNDSEKKVELDRLRGQIDDICASVHQLFVDAPVGSRLETALESAEALLKVARGNLGRASDALTFGGAR